MARRNTVLSEIIDGFLPTINKRKILTGPASCSRDGIQFMDLGRAHIRYRVVGEGKQTLVFETDPPVVIEHYDELVSMLRNDFRIVIFEPPGFGFSIPGMRLDYGFQSMVSMIESFLDKLSLGPYLLIAPCVTAYGAIELAQKRPDMVSHLVLPQAPSWEEMMKWKVGRDPKGLLSIPIVSQLLLQVLKRKRTPSWFQKALGDKALLEPFNEIAQTAYLHGASFNLASAFQRFLIGPLPLSGIVSQPSLFVWGDKDRSHCNTCKESSKSLIESANIVHIPEAGHFPELETPAKFSEHLEKFYRESS
jgi:pimeloyl-ACP methyl ester carboxylesterase